MLRRCSLPAACWTSSPVDWTAGEMGAFRRVRSVAIARRRGFDDGFSSEGVLDSWDDGRSSYSGIVYSMYSNCQRKRDEQLMLDWGHGWTRLG